MTHCDAHKPKTNTWAQKNYERSSSGWEWRSIKKRVLRRDGYRCQIQGCLVRGTEVDHIVPSHKGGSDDMSNLRAICADHHRLKSEQERIAALRNRKGA